MKFHAICENHLFVKAYRTGKKAVCPDVVIYVLPDRHANLLKKQNPEKKKINRIGITVTKTVGKAVVRTRVRRIIRAGFSGAVADRRIRTGFLIVFVGRQSAAESDSVKMKDQIGKGLERLGMFL